MAHAPDTRIAEKKTPPREFSPPRPPNLTEEETAILDHYSVEGLSRAVAEAENAYVTARPAEAAEADRRYVLVLNLIAKLDPPPDPTVPEVSERQQEYLAALPDEEARLAELPAEERGRKLSEFKAAFFEGLMKHPEGIPNGTQ